VVFDAKIERKKGKEGKEGEKKVKRGKKKRGGEVVRCIQA